MGKLARILLKFILLSLSAVIIVGLGMLAIRDLTMVEVSVTYLVDSAAFDIEQPLEVSFANGTEYVVRAPMALKVEENYVKGVTEIEPDMPIIKVNQVLGTNDFDYTKRVEEINREVAVRQAEKRLLDYEMSLSAEQTLLSQRMDELEAAKSLNDINGISQVKFEQAIDNYESQASRVNDLVKIIEAESNSVSKLMASYKEIDTERAILEEEFTFTKDNTIFPTNEEGMFVGRERIVVTYSTEKEFVKAGEVLFKYSINDFTSEVLLEVNGPNESIPKIVEDGIWELYPVNSAKLWFFQFKEDVYDHGKRYLKGELVIPPRVMQYKDIKVLPWNNYNFNSHVRKSTLTIANTELQPKISTYEVASLTLPKNCFQALTGIKPGSIAKIFVVSNETTAFGEESVLRELEVQITHTSDLHAGFTILPNQKNAHLISWNSMDVEIVQSPTEEFFEGLAIKVTDKDYN